MSITLDTPGAGRDRDPVAKVPDVGDSITVHIVDVNEVDIRNFETGDVETFDDGNPKKQKVITGIVWAFEGGAKARADGDDLPLEKGMVVTIWTGYAGFYAYREGLTAHGRPVAVGTVLTWATDSEEPPKRAGFNPFKRRSYRFQTPDGDLAAGVAAAEALYRERHATELDRPDSGSDWDAPF